MDILSVSITLFLIMDPFGNIPIFLPILEKVPDRRRRKVLVRELLFALILIVIFVFCGRYVMNFLGLKQASVSMAGGLILFLIAVRMVFPAAEGHTDKDLEGEPLLVPLAVPLVAGPSLLSVLLLFSTAEPDHLLKLLFASGLAWAGTFAVLFSSTFLIRFLTKRGLIAVERLMGMILVALAVQLFLDGVSAYLK
ncbi:MAG: NAAT family transporter [Desulfobacteraceae bacterium]|nr:MAG: NAAT family transporter [Desulfobacteraceae bacterium]